MNSNVPSVLIFKDPTFGMVAVVPAVIVPVTPAIIKLDRVIGFLSGSLSLSKTLPLIFSFCGEENTSFAAKGASFTSVTESVSVPVAFPPLPSLTV